MTAVFGVVVPDVCSHIKATSYSETLVSVYHTTKRHPQKTKTLIFTGFTESNIIYV